MVAEADADAPRGTGWVVAQFALMGLIVAAAFLPPPWPGEARALLLVGGGLLIVIGLALVVWAARTMGPLLTPFPRPPADGRLVVEGPFAFVRHPVYLGGLLLFGGVALMTSVPALVITVVLGLLWHGKTRVEERYLRVQFPDYAAYVQRVRSSILPLRVPR